MDGQSAFLATAAACSGTTATAHRQLGAVSRTQSMHETYVHCVALDATGHYLATCSSDRRVNIFTRNTSFRRRQRRIVKAVPSTRSMPPTDRLRATVGDTSDSSSSDGDENDAAAAAERDGTPSTWDPQLSMEDHVGTVRKLVWMHRDHNVYLASVGGRRANIYKLGWLPSGAQQQGRSAAPGAPTPSSFPTSMSQSTMSNVATPASTVASFPGSSASLGMGVPEVAQGSHLTATLAAQMDGAENADTICDIAFCPQGQADKDVLLFAVASLDGHVRFYAPANNDKKLSPKFGKICPSDDAEYCWQVACQAVAGGGRSTWAVGVIELRPPPAANACNATSAGGCGGGAAAVGASGRIVSPSTTKIEATPSKSAPAGVSAIAWLNSATESIATIAVGTVVGSLDLYVLTRERKLAYVPLVLTAPTCCGRDVPFSQLRIADAAATCIAWAPAVGRQFDLVAMGTRRGTVIVKLCRKHLPAAAAGTASTTVTVGSSGTPSPVAYDGEVFVSSVPCVNASWDATGTLLTVVSDTAAGMQPTPTAHPSSASAGKRRVPGCATTRPPIPGCLQVLYQSDLSDHQSWIAECV